MSCQANGCPLLIASVQDIVHYWRIITNDLSSEPSNTPVHWLMRRGSPGVAREHKLEREVHRMMNAPDGLADVSDSPNAARSTGSRTIGNARGIDVVRYCAYHGTNVSAAGSIMATGFRKSTQSDAWLGCGVYFWEEKNVAHWWCRQALRLSSYGIIEATIEVATGTLWDLQTKEGFRLYRDLCDEIKKKRPPHLDGKMIGEGTIIDLFCSSVREMDVVVSNMPDTSRRKYDWSKNIPDRRVIFCVRNTDCIKELRVAYHDY